MAVTAFETQSCGRCGGSGSYSFNQIDGTRCFGCGGNGRSYTPRGRAASNFYANMMMKAAKDFAVGEFYKDRCGNQKYRIIAIGPDPHNPTSIRIESERMVYVTSPTDTLRMVPTPAVRDAALALALTFQASLTKAGKPRKVANG